jgi:hypothetical protein
VDTSNGIWKTLVSPLFETKFRGWSEVVYLVLVPLMCLLYYHFANLNVRGGGAYFY